MLLSTRMASLLQGFEELRVVDVIPTGGIGPIGDEVFFGCDVRGAGHLTGWLTHVLWTGVVLAVGVVTKARVLEGVFAFRRVNVGLG